MKKKRRKILFPMIKREWAALRKSWWLKLVLLVIVFIPIIYTGIFLGSMWDPYGNTDEIPVGVVNHDKQVSYNGGVLNVGEDLVDNLKENDSMKFEITDEKTADEKLKSGEYYMTIVIPENFSENATTLLEKNPKEMTIKYITNPGKNYIATKIDETAVNKIKEEVSQTVTETYAKTIFESVGKASEGFKSAYEGSKKLKDGAVALGEGNEKVTSNLETLAKSSLSFQDGADTLKVGIEQYTDGAKQLDSGMSALSDGISELAYKSSSMGTGAIKLVEGSTKLKEGITSYTEGVTTIKDSLTKATENSDALKRGAENLYTGLAQANALSENINQNIKALPSQIDGIIALAKNSDNSEEVVAALEGMKGKLTAESENPQNMGLIQAVNVLNEGVSKAYNGSATLKEGMDAYTSAVEKISQGASALSSQNSLLQQGVADLDTGINSFANAIPTFNSGISLLDNGAKELAKGSGTLAVNGDALKTGSIALGTGATQIADGAGKLSAGSQTLGSGIAQLKEGSEALAAGLSEGVKQSEINTSEENYKMMASPVNTKDEKISVVKNNGSAMAPYMMSVALYVAAMAFTLMYPLLKNIHKAKSGWRYWGGKASVMYIVSTVAAVVMIALLMKVNGLEPQQVMMTYIFAIVVSAAFMSMIVFFNAAFGKIGEFLMLVYMVINLGGSAGTYPLETSAAWAKLIHPFIPFSYSVDGFRNSISMTDSGAVFADMKIFIVMIISFAAATILYYSYRRKNPKPILEEAFS